MNKKVFHSGFIIAILTLVISCVSSSSSSRIEEQAEIARGGLLYDKWYKVIDVPVPTETNSKYPKTSKYSKKLGSIWRCKECHGWDYKGKVGAYSSGSHFTGISGLMGLKDKRQNDIVKKFNEKHQEFSGKIPESDLKALALFISQGQLDMNQYIDLKTKKVKGNVVKGKAYYKTMCSNCHGDDGKMEDMPVMGTLSRKNPWECLHKTLNGQPDAKMPALRALDVQVSVDILAYLQHLPD